MTISAEEAKQLLAENISNQTVENNQETAMADPYNIGARGLLAGLLNAGRGIPNTAFKMAQLLGIPEGKYFHPVTKEQIGLNQILSPQEQHSFPGIAGEFIGESLPLAFAPITRAPSLLGRLGKSAALGGALGPIYSPDQPLLSSAALGAGLGGALGGVGELLSGLRGMGGTASPEKIAELKSAEKPGEELPLGEAIQSPYLKWFQNSVLAKVPFSGMKKRYQNIDEKNIQRMEDILGNIPAQEIYDIPETIVGNLSSKYKNNQLVKTDLYKNLKDKANEHGITINDENYTNTIKESLAPLEKFSKEKPHFKKMSTDSDFINFLKEESKSKSTIDPLTGKEIKKSLDYDTAISTDAEINGLIEKAYQENDRRKVAILKKMQSSLREDIENSVKEAGIPELTQSWEEARNFYKDEIVPYQHKNILPYILGTKRSETIVPFFLKSSRIEQPELFKQLHKFLTPEIKDKLSTYVLSRGGSKEEAKDIAKIYKSIGPQTKKLLFPEEKTKEIESSMKIAEALGGQKNQMFVPKTGHETLGGLGAVAGLTALFPDILSKTLFASSAIGGANLLTKALTNKKSRDFLINRYLKSINKNPKEKKMLSKYSYPALQAILGGENANQ